MTLATDRGLCSVCGGCFDPGCCGSWHYDCIHEADNHAPKPVEGCPVCRKQVGA